MEIFSFFCEKVEEKEEWWRKFGGDEIGEGKKGRIRSGYGGSDERESKGFGEDEELRESEKKE